MRGRVVARSLALVVAALFAASQADAQAQGPKPHRGESAALRLPVAGTTSTGGTFTGTLSVQRFASRNGQDIVAVGMITGTLMAAGAPLGTLLNGPVEVPVAASQTSAGLTPSEGAIRPARGPAPAAPRSLTLVQAQTCGVLHLEFGAITLNVLGVVVTTSPIVLDISGETGGTALLGTLVCQILGALTGAVNLLVGLLNTLLGLLGGLTGGLSA